MVRPRSRLHMENDVTLGSGRGDNKRLAGAGAARRRPQKHASVAETVGAGVLGDITNISVPAASHACPAKMKALCSTHRGLLAEEVLSTDESAVEVASEHAEDPQRVLEYVDDIYHTLKQAEAVHALDPKYLEKQPHITAGMRAILVDWLVDVHSRKFDLCPQTLYLCVSLIDRFLGKKLVARSQLQLVGIAGLLIASKYEDRYPPSMDELVTMTDNAYTQDALAQMEISMLTTLQFQICIPTPQHFLERLQIVNACSDLHCSVSAFVLELTLLEHSMVQHAPSFLAATAIFLSNKLMGRQQLCWTQALDRETSLEERKLRGCARELCGCLEAANRSKLQAITKKYSLEKQHSVSKLAFPLAPGQ